MPAKLIEKIKKSRQYNTAYLCLRQLSFGFLDMAWYTQTDSIENVIEFEQKAMAPTQLLPIVDGTGMSNQFGHIFSGGYAAGYYGYKWAEVLDADAFSYLKKKVSSIEKLPNPLEKIFSKKEVQKIRWNCINVFADMNLL